MAGEDIIMARPKELRHLYVIRKVLDKEMTPVEASEVLSLSSRQIRRIMRRVRLEGDKGVIHKSRGRRSNRRIPDAIREKAIQLYRCQYWDFGPTLASEKLLERHGIGVNDETLRLWLMESGDWEKRRKRRGHRRWRERKHHLGEMVQMDGSHHDWFEGRGPWCVLMGYIDDATGKVFGKFYDYEGTIPALDSFRGYMKKHGLPMAVYVDQHTTYKSPAKVSLQDELANRMPLSEFERALEELGVKVIHATSAPAKGRVERLFGTLQDRLVKEMRLRGLRTVKEANDFLKRYLPLYNRRFSVRPQEIGDFHRPLPPGVDLDSILCITTERTLRNDFTVGHNRKLYQIEDRTCASRIMVQEHIDGSIKMVYKGQALRFREIMARPLKEEPSFVPAERVKPQKPSPHHPWRDFKFGSHRYEKGKAILNDGSGGNGAGKVRVRSESGNELTRATLKVAEEATSRRGGGKFQSPYGLLPFPPNPRTQVERTFLLW
jgi:transposase-like protein